MIVELARRIRLVLAETVWSFRRNNDLRAASSLAFSLAIALIPALFLVTAIAGIAVGSSQTALARMQEVLQQLLPEYSKDILREVRNLTAYRGAISAVNALVLLLTVTPLVSSLRDVLGAVFRGKPGRPFLLEKLYDVALTIVFRVGITAIGVMGIVVTVVEKHLPLSVPLHAFGTLVLFLFLVITVFLLYAAFSPGVTKRHLALGALAATALWFLMRPLFHLFITFNPGYGFAFGSFKSLFVVIIWLYYSLVVFLFGAELAAAVGRRELAAVRRLMAGRRDVPTSVAGRYLVRYRQGERIFGMGDAGGTMFHVLRGSVTIGQGDREITTVREGQYFGMVSFLLDTPRIASAVAAADTELVMIDRQNISDLLQESPELIHAMLREIAGRMAETTMTRESAPGETPCMTQTTGGGA
jgi:membrane protein